MNIDDTVLLAYVDGELPPEGRSEVDAAVAHSADLSERLAALRASVLPYGAAFDRQVLPPLPAELTGRVAELLSVSGASGSVSHRGAFWPRLAAAFFIGALAGAAALHLWPSDAAQQSDAVAPWIRAVADYQQLYSRETLANVIPDEQLTTRVIGELQRQDAMPVRIPDLRSAGLTFKRVQRLSFHDQAVVQIVYLPEDGSGPVALCVTRDARPDARPQAQQVGEMRTVAWRQDHLGYVLLDKGSARDLDALGHQIASGEAAALFSRLAPAARGARAALDATDALRS